LTHYKEVSLVSTHPVLGRNVVVGFDGSANAHLALEAAAELVTDGGIVHVVTAYDPPSARQMSEIMASMPAEFRNSFDLLAPARSYLESAEGFLGRVDVDCKGHFVDGHPAKAILDVADDVDADLVVVGSRGIGRGTRYIRGSVSARVASHAKTSFLIVHDHDDSAEIAEAS
jgi:nucleotide-binding universal stress UspA family protein